MEDVTQEFYELWEIVNKLRKECPWDSQQTFESLRPLTIEEVYELSEAIICSEAEPIREELGDILLHVLLYSSIADENSSFTLKELIAKLKKKLIFRHPHIFSDLKVSGEREVSRNWENLKLKEGRQSIFQGVSKSLPSLIKSVRLQEKASAVGFDWSEIKEVWTKVEEEMEELKEAEETKVQSKINEEFGDLLFALVNYGRFLKIDPDEALEKANGKFIRRFRNIEDKASSNGSVLSELSLEELDEMWNQAKKETG